jgi:hypothetical protein
LGKCIIGINILHFSIGMILTHSLTDPSNEAEAIFETEAILTPQHGRQHKRGLQQFGYVCIS